MAENKLAGLSDFANSALFSEREKVALDYAEAMTCERGVDEYRVERLKAFFTDGAIIEFTALIAYHNMSSKFNAALGMRSDSIDRRRQLQLI